MNKKLIRKMLTASGGPIYEEDWSDKLEPYAASVGLAGDVVGLGTAATGVGIPVGAVIAGFANIPNLIIDGYQTARDTWRSFNDNGNSLGSAAWNGGELILDAAGLKALQYVNKAAKAGVASEKYLTSTEKALDSKPWKRVGTGHGRVRARQSADHKRKYNSGRNKALEESNIELAKRGVRPALGLYYQQKLTDEMAKRGYGVAVNDAIKSANRTLRQNLGIISGVSGGTNLYHIFKKEKGGMLQLLKSGSGIHIKEKNKGKFTSYCGGKVTDECILKGKNSSNPAIRKRATFADNARHFKHKEGGSIEKLEKGSWIKNSLSFLNESGLGKTLLEGGLSFLLSSSQNKSIAGATDVAKAELDKEGLEAEQLALLMAKQKVLEMLLIDPNNPNAFGGSIVLNYIRLQLYNEYLNSINLDIANRKALLDMLSLQMLNENTSGAISGIIQSGLRVVGNLLGEKNNFSTNNTGSSTKSIVLPKLTNNKWTPSTSLSIPVLGNNAQGSMPNYTSLLNVKK